jgi:hypothetical protein
MIKQKKKMRKRFHNLGLLSVSEATQQEERLITMATLAHRRGTHPGRLEPRNASTAGFFKKIILST